MTGSRDVRARRLPASGTLLHGRVRNASPAQAATRFPTPAHVAHRVRSYTAEHAEGAGTRSQTAELDEAPLAPPPVGQLAAGIMRIAIVSRNSAIVACTHDHGVSRSSVMSLIYHVHVRACEAADELGERSKQPAPRERRPPMGASPSLLDLDVHRGCDGLIECECQISEPHVLARQDLGMRANIIHGFQQSPRPRRNTRRPLDRGLCLRAS
jgi:hypothetical protein